VDDFGYKTDEPKTVEAPKTTEPEKKTEEKPVEKAVTGYGKESEAPPTEDKTKEPEKKEADAPSTDEEKLKKELEEVAKDFPESVDKEKVLKFAQENKLTKEQLEAYKNFSKEEQKEIETAQKEFVKKQRSEWLTELKTDPEFGNEQFDKNVDRVEKVLEKYLPNMKKQLTERGSMLPPYIMRDLLALSKVLNPTTEFVSGDPVQAESKDNNFLDSMYS
jgi:transposase